MAVAHEIYCLNCFSMIPAEAETCPMCGEGIASLSAQSYREKLLHGLDHPLSEVRMRAIIALGWRGEGRAAQPLLELALQHPVDVVEGLAVVESLARMGIDGQIAMATLAERHRAHAVREAAQQALRRIRHTKH